MNKHMKRFQGLVTVLMAAVFAVGGAASTSVWAAVPADFVELVAQQSPVVVNITTIQRGEKWGEMGGERGGQSHRNLPPGMRPDTEEMFDFFRRFMPPEGERFMPPKRGQGSGFIVSADGEILTNAHVVEGAEEVLVKLSDRREYRAKVVGADARTDVALIRIQAERLPVAKMAEPGRLRAGEWVIAIGAPFGFENSVTAGIVSAVGRSLPDENYVPFIQTDVAVNPGNSGGPLLNMRGEVVGMNSQIISRNGGYMGLSFAIPIDVALEVAAQLKDKGRVTRGRLGVLIQDVSADLAESFGLERPQGALVVEVESGGPADKAGLLPSDIIVRFNGRAVNQSSELPRFVAAVLPGQKSTLGVWRKGHLVELSVVAGELKDEEESKQAIDSRPAGLVVNALSADEKRQLNVKSGVKVVDAMGAAARAGIRPNDVILSVNNQPVASAGELERLLNDTTRKTAALLVRRGDRTLYVALRLERP